MTIVQDPERRAALEERKALDKEIREKWPDIRAYVRAPLPGDLPPFPVPVPRFILVVRNNNIAQRHTLWGDDLDEATVSAALEAAGLPLDTALEEVRREP